MNKKWYLQTWFICAMAALWPLYGVPLVIAIVLIFIQHNSTKELEKAFGEIEGVDKYAEVKKTEAEELIQKAHSEADDIITQANAKAQNIINEKQLELSHINEEISKKSQYLKEVEDIKTEYEKISKQIDSQHKKLSKIKTIYKSMEHSINCYYDDFVSVEHLKLPKQDMDFTEELAPTVTLKLHSMDIKDLRKAYNDNGKLITDTLAKYESRYTTKANAAIYKLMVIALKAELQNILYNLKYDKLDKSIGYIKETTQKYLTVASDGNQSIAGTMVKFIGEIEFLFINALKIEYEYYVKKEREKAEQAAIRAQMRQEAEEQKALEQQRKQVEMEEAKYKAEITKVQEMLTSAEDDDKIKQLMAKIAELENQLDLVEHQKEDIINLQNGKAGHVYIISNVGSFGKNVFKIGMTRRLDPLDRVKELGDASVPFPFDIHSFIFSEDAVDLENRLHASLEQRRVNKINLRKEFFNVSLDELENLVLDIDPSAEFNRTMLAEEYKQTQTINEELSMVS
jgi:F0F1-type ATP synthase membrane subunit b/b'